MGTKVSVTDTLLPRLYDEPYGAMRHSEVTAGKKLRFKQPSMRSLIAWIKFSGCTVRV